MKINKMKQNNNKKMNKKMKIQKQKNKSNKLEQCKEKEWHTQETIQTGDNNSH